MTTTTACHRSHHTGGREGHLDGGAPTTDLHELLDLRVLPHPRDLRARHPESAVFRVGRVIGDLLRDPEEQTWTPVVRACKYGIGAGPHAAISGQQGYATTKGAPYDSAEGDTGRSEAVHVSHVRRSDSGTEVSSDMPA